MRRSSSPGPDPMSKRRLEIPTLSIPERLALAEKILDHRFADVRLLQRALTHPSAADVGNPSSYYERLEFLGDSIIGFVVAEELYRRYPDMSEGGLTRIKVSVVAGCIMSTVAAELGLTDALILGDSEMGTGGRGLTSALENSYEALTAALYLDAGLETATEWVLRTLGPLISEDTATTPENPKSALQEIVQAHGDAPVYRIASQEGPPHERVFRAVVEVAGRQLGEGVGRTKKEAEATAAAAAIEALKR